MRENGRLAPHQEVDRRRSCHHANGTCADRWMYKQDESSWHPAEALSQPGSMPLCAPFSGVRWQTPPQHFVRYLRELPNIRACFWILAAPSAPTQRALRSLSRAVCTPVSESAMRLSRSSACGSKLRVPGRSFQHWRLWLLHGKESSNGSLRMPRAFALNGKVTAHPTFCRMKC